MSRVTFEAGRWPLVAELPPPPPPQGVRRRRLRDDGWRVGVSPRERRWLGRQWRPHNHRFCKFSLPGFKLPMPSLCFAGILHRRAASPNSVPPLLHLVWTRLVNLFVCWDEHPPVRPKVSNYFEFLDVRF
ncbi:hypothetical protein B296_00012582 [Ensete ventricosum]|uniref:Uncharacterized protein n=1 Tax=Ensete ventricosum TaxID=4639 RepID=A0A427AEK1_ENSVE|nr:hypothetical protein B296_00012582 [Ensete ventricosum]